jgi:hypothetical protein
MAPLLHPAAKIHEVALAAAEYFGRCYLQDAH